MRALVTGAGGFLGGALARRLRARGDEVRTFQRGHYPALGRDGIEQIRGDLADAAAVARAVDGCDTVFHVAGKVGVWGDYDEFRRCNVLGTQNVIDQCAARGVARLVFTSSPSVVFSGRNDEGIDESAPYAPRYVSDYPRTKAIAEQCVLRANGPKLATIALRPHLVWGPGDTHLIPRIVESARRGRLRLVGDGGNLVDSTYIDNAVDCHLLAAERLEPGADCAGRAYFVSNGEPLAMATLIDKILVAAKLPRRVKSISPRNAYWAGAVFETVFRALKIRKEPVVTRFVAMEMATAHWFDISAARRDLDYRPAVSVDAGMQSLARWLAS